MGIRYDDSHTTLSPGANSDRLDEESRQAQDVGMPQAAKGASELARANLQLTEEIKERRRAEVSLQSAYAEIKGWKDRLQAENIYLQQEVAQEYNFGELIGQSSAMLQVRQRVEQVAALPAAVLLQGEPGTGKGVVARAIHNLSSRRDRPMITVNLAALPANLVESELFGWERGELTGADGRQIGRIELASDGTLLLEEISELPMELQGKLLRLIQDGEIERLGSPRTIQVRVRVIAASSRDLEQEVRDGRFREDLFNRLKVFPLGIPPLRQHKEDIAPLVQHFLTKYKTITGKKGAVVSSDTMSSLEAYHWPGNVRELESVIERALITSHGPALQLMGRPVALCPSERGAGEEIKALAELEYDHILHVLQKTGWRIEGDHGAAGLLGLNPSTLRARMRKFGILRQYQESL